MINNITHSDAYFVVAERLQMKDRLNPGTFTLSLSGSNSAGGIGKTLNLTDDSKVNNATAAPFGERYSIQVGSVGVISDTTEHGHFYPDAGIFVLSANQLSASLPGKPTYVTSKCCKTISNFSRNWLNT